MRLLSCHISAFGGLSQFDVDFKSDLTCLFEKNGFGKTTLAAFVKAMFYGMPTANKRSSTIENCDRLKYFPWGGGNFGGQLVFSVNEKSYRIIRFFDRESASRDSFQLLDAQNSSETHDFSENIGNEIFGVDEEGFSRSVFLNGTPCLDALPVSIRSKISSIIDSTDDFDDYEKALESLLKAKKDLDGKTGEIAVCDRKIQNARLQGERLKRDAEEFVRLSKHVCELENQSREIRKKIDELNRSLTSAARQEADALKLKNYEKLCSDAQELKAELENILEKYGGHCPSEEQILLAERLYSECAEKSVILSQEAQRLSKDEFKRLENLFNGAVPSEEELSELANSLRQIDIHLNQIEQLNKKAEQLKRELELFNVTLAYEVSDDTLNSLRLSGSREKASAGKKTNFVLLFVLAAVSLTAGFVTMVFNLIAGIALTSVGAVGLIAALLLASVKKMLGDSVQSESERNAVKKFLNDFNFPPDTDINAAVDRVKNARATLDELNNIRYDLNLENEKLSSLSEKTDDILHRYYPSFENRTAAFESLKNSVIRYFNEVLPSLDRKRELEKEIENAEKQIREQLSALSVNSAVDIKKAVFELREDFSKFFSTKLRLEKLEKEAEEFFLSNKIAQISNSVQPDATEQISLNRDRLEERFEQIGNELAQTRQTMQLLSNAQNELNELDEIIESETELRSSYKLRADILGKTAELLQKAKNELSQKYAGSIGKAFEHYSKIFFGEAAGGFMMGSDLRLTVNREGVARAANQFSQGQRSVMDVCLHLSLIDAMFEKQKPFLLLDDPFADMDEENFKKAAELLKNVSREMQIVYFTCHPSRKIQPMTETDV